MKEKNNVRFLAAFMIAAVLIVTLGIAAWVTGFFGPSGPESGNAEATLEAVDDIAEEDRDDGTTWSTVAVGEDHACAIHGSGSLWCWGNNAYGQVGDGTRIRRQAPVQISDSQDWADIAVGTAHTCAAREDGGIYCWGRNEHGQFGNGTRDDYAAPVASGADGEERWSALIAGTSHTCGISDGRAYCWGDNQNGQLGDGTEESRTRPTPVEGDAAWRMLSAATYYTCGIQDDGSLWCWGGSDRDHPLAQESVPTRLGDHADWVDISAGDFHTCGLREGGELHCWGNAAGGRLPHVDDWEMKSFSDEPSTTDSWSAVSAKARKSCGITEEGAISCWGDSDHEPQQPSTDLSDWEQISIGRTMGCAIRQEGDLYCWTDAELGDPLGDPAERQAAGGGADEEAVEEVDSAGPRPVEFFAVHDQNLQWYRVDQDGLDLLRELRLPHPLESMAWVPGRGLAISVLGQSDEAESFCADRSPGCQPRTLFFLPHDDLQGALQAVDLPPDLNWSYSGYLPSDDFPEMVDRGALRSTTDGELWLARCHAIFGEMCPLYSAMHLFPTTEQSTKGFYAGAGELSWDPEPIAKAFDAPPDIDLLYNSYQVLCLSGDGSSFVEPEDADHMVDLARPQWISYDPPIVSTGLSPETGNSQNPEDFRILRTLYRACEAEALSDSNPRFGPEGVYFLSSGDENSEKEIYFDGRRIGQFSGEQVVFRPQDEEEVTEPIDGEFSVQDPDLSALGERVRRAWMGFAHTEPACAQSYASIQDHRPTMVRVYCHLRNFGTLDIVEDALGMPVFLKGPHIDGKMNLHSRDSFGHYNPEFVRTLRDWALPVLEDDSFRDTTRPLYDRYLKDLANTYDEAYRVLLADEDGFDAAQQEYRESIGTNDGSWSRDIAVGQDYRAVGFWTRRGIDGTHELFAEGLQALREIYE